MGRLIIISNRLPYTIDKSGDDVIVRQSSGGLVSAIKSYFERSGAENNQQFSGKVWIGGTDANEEDWKLVQDMNALPQDFGVQPVFMDKEV
ncbi:MAG: bifunctional alpha,alpha-trehalose-phosphate synthase (UDP-forming)/trehalose-phosphatase, partial [Flavisolibacter sp.]|nr:bifunctional alpha,alpha-trehalose-phosphate synthase (UDP-forming)/trehalose-phosphatase [Flavisolibacter sp.]